MGHACATIPQARRFVAADGDSLWINCVEMPDVFKALQAYGSRPHRLVVGNTSTGVVKYYPQYKNDQPDVFINIGGVAPLHEITTDDSSITFGATVTLSEMLQRL